MNVLGKVLQCDGRSRMSRTRRETRREDDHRATRRHGGTIKNLYIVRRIPHSSGSAREHVLLNFVSLFGETRRLQNLLLPFADDRNRLSKPVCI
jgi:hypothetical protein